MLQVFGNFTPPTPLADIGTLQGGGLGSLLQLGFQILVIGAGIYSMFNFMMAGYAFLSAGNDPKKVENAWAKIWQTVLGLAVVAGSFVLAAIFGQLLFNDALFIIKPSIPTLT